MTVPTNKQLLGEKRTCSKFQIDISITEELFQVYRDRQRDMAKCHHADNFIRFAITDELF